ncbi:MAG: hypothetical protein AB8B74_02500 [Crocinitomicaceae bacterium]
MKTIATLLISFCILSISAQNLGKFSFKDEGFTQKKFNHTEKKIYIKSFSINYQTVMIEYAKARGGTNYGSATAGLALGLDNIDPEKLQQITDKYYKEFVEKLKAEGFTIVTAEKVSQNENYNNLQLYKGGNPSMDVIADGYLTTVPTGVSFLQHKNNPLNLGGMPDSKNLNGVIVCGVNLVIPFAQTREINGGPVGGVAKITAKCDLRISPSETLPAKGDFRKPKILLTDVTFGYKESLKWQALSRTKLSKPLEVENVLDEEKKYKATSVSTTGSSFSARYSKAYAKNAILVPCDSVKYRNGVSLAIDKYLSTASENFLGSFK